MAISRGYKGESMKVGDLVELSAYGSKISQNLRYHDKLGIIQRIKERSATHTYVVLWFHGQRTESTVNHPRKDLKHYKKEVK